MVALTTEKEVATLTARFDMLFTEEMKAYVKAMGGASYLRDLVAQDVTRRMNLASIPPANDEEQRLLAAAYLSDRGK